MTDDAQITTRRRGGRAIVAAARQAERIPRLADVRYGISPVTALSEAQLDRIHTASMSILRDIGIEFRDETALAQWRRAGARVEGTRVYLDEDMIMGLIAKAPARFTIHGRNPEVCVYHPASAGVCGKGHVPDAAGSSERLLCLVARTRFPARVGRSAAN